MNLIRRLIAAAVLVASGTDASAQSFKLGAIEIGHPSARPTVAGQPGGAFFTLVNHGGDDRLIGVSTDAAASAEMHSMSMEGNVMKMRQVASIDVPAGKTVELKPGGYHLMFVGLKAPLKAGETFPVRLRFEKAGDVEVTVNVDAPRTGSATQHAH